MLGVSADHTWVFNQGTKSMACDISVDGTLVEHDCPWNQYATARGTIGFSSGRHQWTIRLDNPVNVALGVQLADFVLGKQFNVDPNPSLAWMLWSDGRAFHEGASSQVTEKLARGATIQFDLDMDKGILEGAVDGRPGKFLVASDLQGKTVFPCCQFAQGSSVRLLSSSAKAFAEVPVATEAKAVAVEKAVAEARAIKEASNDVTVQQADGEMIETPIAASKEANHKVHEKVLISGSEQATKGHAGSETAAGSTALSSKISGSPEEPCWKEIAEPMPSTPKDILMKFKFEGNFYRVPVKHCTDIMQDIKKAIEDATGCSFASLWAKYLDDEGDLCVLCATTLPDCLNLMSKSKHEPMVMRLELHARASGALRGEGHEVCAYQASKDQKAHGVSKKIQLPWQVEDSNSDSDSDVPSADSNTDEEQSIRDVANNDKTEFVFVDSQQERDRCFLKARTVVRSPDGSCQTVASLQEGDHILSYSGRQLRVASVKEHPQQLCKLTTLRTSAAELIVTSDHRIVVSKGDGTSSEKAADQIVLGDKVLCGQKPQKVTKVMQHQQRVELVELRFTPDEPVETLMIAHAGILTKGERNPLLAKLERPIPGLEVAVRRTFLDVRDETNHTAKRRSVSAER